MTDDRTIRWGLIGASTIAHQYVIPAIKAQPDCEVLSVMSRSEERARAYANENGIAKSVHRMDDLLSDPDVDAVYISTTNERHRDATLAAASAGKHVLCEKPLALEVPQAQQMVEECERAGVVLATNHHLRNAATHRTMKRLVSEGAIGEPLAARVFHAVYLPPDLQTWRVKSPDAGGGVILDITVHDTDTLRFVLGAEVEEVTALGAGQGLAESQLQDAVMGVMRFDNGILAQFHDAYTIKHGLTGFQVHGTDASLIAENVMTQDPVGHVSLVKLGNPEPVDLGKVEDLYTCGVRQFAAAIKGNGEPAATGQDGVRSLAVALAVAESAATGQTVRVQYP